MQAQGKKQELIHYFSIPIGTKPLTGDIVKEKIPKLELLLSHFPY
jgi:hypothetical protein